MITIATEVYCLYATFGSLFGASIACIRQDFNTNSVHYQDSGLV